jgi:hypothetical protein
MVHHFAVTPIHSINEFVSRSAQVLLELCIDIIRHDVMLDMGGGNGVAAELGAFLRRTCLSHHQKHKN